MYERSAPIPPRPQRIEARRFLGRFPGRLTSVKDARDWLGQRLDLARIPEPPTHDALLLLSEVTTNALLHTPAREGSGAFFVSLFAYPHCLRVSVRGSRGTSVPRLQVVPAEGDAENGRGLFLVNALASTWGVERTRYGSAVYFTLGWDPQQPPEPSRPTGQLCPNHQRCPAQQSLQPPVVPSPPTALRHLGG